jgi:hypothetical protein
MAHSTGVPRGAAAETDAILAIPPVFGNPSRPT